MLSYLKKWTTVLNAQNSFMWGIRCSLLAFTVLSGAQAFSSSSQRRSSERQLNARYSDEDRGGDKKNDPLSRFYGYTSLDFSRLEKYRNTPATDQPIATAEFNLNWDNLVGWGPARYKKGYFTLWYQYLQEMVSDPDQVDIFLSEWTSDPTSENFLFPFSAQDRSHSINFDFRVVEQTWQAGLFTQLGIKRRNSSVFGPEEAEAETVATWENFMPYLTLRFGKFYRGTLFLPFVARVNKRVGGANIFSYSLPGDGRNASLSLFLNNAFFLPMYHTTFDFDLSWQEFRGNNLKDDFRRYGLSTAFHFPILKTLRIFFKAFYAYDSYYETTPSISDFGEIPGVESTSVADELNRVDQNFDILLKTSYSLTQRHTFFAQLAILQRESTIAEHTSSKRGLSFGYTYTWPDSLTVQWRTSRYSSTNLHQDFERQEKGE